MNFSATTQAQTSVDQDVRSRSNKEGRALSEVYLQPILLLLLGASLLLTNRWFTEVDDECAIIDRAAQPILQTIRLYLSGAGEHEHPPLYDLILHGWLQLTSGAQHLLRLPAIAFYLAGAWVIASAAQRRAGSAARKYVLLLILLWPYGFHFGRVATWYSFCFLLVALVTWTYFRYLENPVFGHWLWLAVCSVLLVYTNYFSWAVLGCLALDFTIRNRTMSPRRWAGLAGTCLLVFLSAIPIAGAFLTEFHQGVRTNTRMISVLFTGLYDVYSVFVSESVAPWFWGLGVPVAVAVLICCLITLYVVPARRFLLYFAVLVAVMAVLGISNTKRMLFISPWLILPVGTALAEAGRIGRRTLSAALVFIAAVGWYGIFSRSFYAAPHWLEPWEKIAADEASAARGGEIVIGNNPSFFFYLTYDLAPMGAPVESERIRHFDGLLPDSTRRRNVFDAPQWIDAGRPAAGSVNLVKGPPFNTPSMQDAEQWLNGRCTIKNKRQLVHDAGAELKERFAPDTDQVPWRIEIIAYSCP